MWCNSMVASVADAITIFEKAKEFIDKYKFKKEKILLIVDRTKTPIEKSETIIEGDWDGWLNNPPGLFLKDVEMYDRVQKVSEHMTYSVEGSIPSYSGKISKENLQKKDIIFVSANSIKFIEFNKDE